MEIENMDSTLDLVAPTSYIKGEYHYNQFARIEGRFQGLIKATDPAEKSLLVISNLARVEADVECHDMVVEGILYGNIQANGVFEIKENGSFVGNVKAKNIVIQPGAFFEGSCNMEEVRKAD